MADKALPAVRSKMMPTSAVSHKSHLVSRLSVRLPCDRQGALILRQPRQLLRRSARGPWQSELDDTGPMRGCPLRMGGVSRIAAARAPQGGIGMGATAVLSEFASKTRISDISAEAVAATKRHILDCAGVALAAAVEPAGRIVLDITREQGGAPQARVLGSSLRTSTRFRGMGQRCPRASAGLRRHRLFAPDRLHPAGRTCDGRGGGRDRRRSGGRRLCRPGGLRAAVVVRPAARAGTAAARLSPHLAVRVFGGGGGGGQHRRTEPQPDGRRHRACGGQRRRADPALRHVGQGHSRGQRGTRRRDLRPAGARRTTSPTPLASRATTASSRRSTERATTILERWRTGWERTGRLSIPA